LSRHTQLYRLKLALIGALVLLTIFGLSMTLYSSNQVWARGNGIDFNATFRPSDQPQGFESEEFEQWFVSSFSKDGEKYSNLS